MGTGVPSGLQNQHEGLIASWVGSIPMYSRQEKPLDYRCSIVFFLYVKCWKIISVTFIIRIV